MQAIVHITVALKKDLIHLGKASFEQIFLTTAIISFQCLFPFVISPFPWLKARALIT